MMHVLRYAALLVAGASYVHALSGNDLSYVVEMHPDRESFVQPPNWGELQPEIMTLASGQQFECFFPSIQSEEDSMSSEEARTKKLQEEEDRAFVSFARTAVGKIMPRCVQYADVQGNWVYEVCPTMLLRKINLKPYNYGSSAVSGVGSKQPSSHTVHSLGKFTSDGIETAVSYNEFIDPTIKSRLESLSRPLFTQTFVEDDHHIRVQFMCSDVQSDNAVAAVEMDGTRSISAFLVTSHVFCDAKFAGLKDHTLFPVRSLLKPLADAHVCSKRNDGWWTYEFCIGQGVRQYHRNGNGRIVTDYNLGTFDQQKNTQMEANGAALVMEHIDATHDVSRPAFVEVYTKGTPCREFDVVTQRKTTVYYYCSPGGSTQHILSVKEGQTCDYTLKLSTPAVCDHPHFINHDQRGEDTTESIHCLPLDPTAIAAK